MAANLLIIGYFFGVALLIRLVIVRKPISSVLAIGLMLCLYFGWFLILAIASKEHQPSLLFVASFVGCFLTVRMPKKKVAQTDEVSIGIKNALANPCPPIAEPSTQCAVSQPLRCHPSTMAEAPTLKSRFDENGEMAAAGVSREEPAPPGITMIRLSFAAALTLIIIAGVIAVSREINDSVYTPHAQPAISLTELARKAGPCTFLIEVFDKTGRLAGTGSGFTVSADGLLVTNHHVIEGAAKVEAIDERGNRFEVLGVVDQSIENDVSIVRLAGSAFSFLGIAECDSVEIGQSITILGYPLGIRSLSEGIVASTICPDALISGFQISAPISPGSSGSPVMDKTGQVVGIATLASRKGIQNMNFAIGPPVVNLLIHSAKHLNEIVSFESVDSDHSESEGFAPYSPIADTSEKEIGAIDRLERARHPESRTSSSVFQRDIHDLAMRRTESYNTSGHKKAQGINLKITYPRSWKAEEGNQPNIVQKFRSDRGRGVGYFTIIVSDELPSELKITGIQQELIWDRDFYNSLFPAGSKNVSIVKTTMDGVPAIMLSYRIKRNNVGLEVEMNVNSFARFVGRNLVILSGNLVRMPTESVRDFTVRVEESTLLYQGIASSAIITNM